MIASLSAALNELESSIAHSETQNLTANTALLIFARTPLRPMFSSEISVYSVNVKAGGGGSAKSVESIFRYVPNPVGAASVTQHMPERVDISGTTMDSVLTVVMSNFAIIHNSSELVIMVAGERAAAALTIDSSRQQTSVKFISPPILSVGKTRVDIFPTFLPGNKATFYVEFYDKSAPVWTNTIPYDIYMDGADLVTGGNSKIL